MNKQRKVDLLYKKARGQYLDATKIELQELKKYKVDYNEGEFFATKKNLNQYVTDVDNGCKQTFYDWCRNNKKADRRMKNSSEKDMESFNKEQNTAAMFLGWLTWGVGLYWIFGGLVHPIICMILGVWVAKVIFGFTRKIAMFSVFVLPMILAIVFFELWN